jgi:hypothetical protein
MSAFALEDDVVYHAYSAYARALDGLWGMFQWLDRAHPRDQRDGRLVAPPRRVQQGLSEVVVVLAQLRDRRSHEHGFRASFPAGVSWRLNLLFAANAAVTSWCASMSAMCEMPMPGGWTMSMAWMRMPGQTWTGVAASFLGMWVVMMVAMMLPSFVPMLLRHRIAFVQVLRLACSRRL